MKSIWQSFNNKGFLICLCVSVFLFGGGIALGLAASPSALTDAGFAVDFGSFAELIKPFSFATMLIIFAKNILSVVLCFVLSPFFLIMPFVSLSFNGLLIGMVSGVVVSEQSVGFLLAGLLPHGIAEVPALLIAGAAAFSFGSTTLRAAFSERGRESFLPDFVRCLRWMAVAVALLFLAAVIETYVTPLFMGVQ
jgi:stage II sporulation protein M